MGFWYWTDNAITVTMTRADRKFSVTQRTGEVTQLCWQNRIGEREEYFTRYTRMKCGNCCLKSTVRTDEYNATDVQLLHEEKLLGYHKQLNEIAEERQMF